MTDNSAMAAKFRSNCPLNIALELFGDKWSLLVMRNMLVMGHYRYRDFLGAPEKISTNILSNRLKRLESHGFIEKYPDPEDGKSAYYLPTEFGLTLLPVLFELLRWGSEHFEQSGMPERVSTALADGVQGFIELRESEVRERRAGLAHL